MTRCKGSSPIYPSDLTSLSVAWTASRPTSARTLPRWMRWLIGTSITVFLPITSLPV